MKSPITGLEMRLSNESCTLTFRKERITIKNLFYLCEESGEQFTTTELDELNLLQVHNQYRDKHNLPFPLEIREIRLKYGLSAKKMSEVLGFGVNSYRNYEQEEMPSISNGRMIQLMENPEQFLAMLEKYEPQEWKKKKQVIQAVKELIISEKENEERNHIEQYLLKDSSPDSFTGYVKPDLNKLTEMIVFFAQELKPFKTKLNKLLFYSDFLSYKQSCFSISGAKYRAIQMGPVLYNFGSVFEYMANENHIEVEHYDFGNEKTGEKFVPASGRVFDSTKFSDAQISILINVADHFKGKSTQEIVNLSHQEKAWLDNYEKKSLIEYHAAFDLNYF